MPTLSQLEIKTARDSRPLKFSENGKLHRVADRAKAALCVACGGPKTRDFDGPTNLNKPIGLYLSHRGDKRQQYRASWLINLYTRLIQTLFGEQSTKQLGQFPIHPTTRITRWNSIVIGMLQVLLNSKEHGPSPLYGLDS